MNELQKSNTTARWYGGLSQISAIDHLKWRANDLNDYQPYDSCRINEEWPIRGPITVLVISEMIFLSPSVLKLPFLSQQSAFFSFVLALSNKRKEERKAKKKRSGKYALDLQALNQMHFYVVLVSFVQICIRCGLLKKSLWK